MDQDLPANIPAEAPPMAPPAASQAFHSIPSAAPSSAPFDKAAAEALIPEAAPSSQGAPVQTGLQMNGEGTNPGDVNGIPEAFPDPETAKALAAEGVKPGDIIETDSGEKLRIGNDTAPNVFSKPHSKTQASCGRIVHVYSNRWRGPRPGVVVQAWGVSGDHQLINVSVIQDGLNDKALEPGTLGSVGLYDPLTGEERDAIIFGSGASSIDNPARYHCEWMPFQAGQAGQTKDISGPLSKAVCKIGTRLMQLEKAFRTYLSSPEHNSTDAGFAQKCADIISAEPDGSAAN